MKASRYAARALDFGGNNLSRAAFIMQSAMETVHRGWGEKNSNNGEENLKKILAIPKFFEVQDSFPWKNGR